VHGDWYLAFPGRLEQMGKPIRQRIEVQGEIDKLLGEEQNTPCTALMMVLDG